MAYLTINIKSKWLQFRFVDKRSKTSVWEVLHKDGELLGEVLWCAQWRQYVFCPEGGMQFSKGCLEDVNKFMVELRQKELEEAEKLRCAKTNTESVQARGGF